MKKGVLAKNSARVLQMAMLIWCKEMKAKN